MAFRLASIPSFLICFPHPQHQAAEQIKNGKRSRHLVSTHIWRRHPQHTNKIKQQEIKNCKNRVDKEWAEEEEEEVGTKEIKQQ